MDYLRKHAAQFKKTMYQKRKLANFLRMCFKWIKLNAKGNLDDNQMEYLNQNMTLMYEMKVRSIDEFMEFICTSDYVHKTKNTRHEFNTRKNYKVSKNISENATILSLGDTVNFLIDDNTFYPVKINEIPIQSVSQLFLTLKNVNHKYGKLSNLNIYNGIYFIVFFVFVCYYKYF